MGQSQFDSLGRRIVRPHRKCYHYLEVLPKLAHIGGQAWASDFARLSAEEQRTIVLRMVAGTARYRARRAGYPDPIIYEAIVKSLPGGGFALDQSVPMVPLRFEYGGDGRTDEDARWEARYPATRANVNADSKLAKAAARIQAKLEAMGINIAVAESEPESVGSKHKRRA